MKVVYSERHWKLLRKKREKALKIMERLASLGPIVYGSVARGDVDEESDVDIVIPHYVEPYKLELLLGDYDHGYIVMATPSSTPKVYLALDEREEVVVSFPLGKLTTREREFYTFGGELDIRGLIEGKRVPGVNKSLVLILPTEDGHVEESIIGKEDYVARILGISSSTVRERVRILSRRKEKGRTGTFIKQPLVGGIEETIAILVRKNKVFRERLREEGII